jgi:hypothetical protein
MAPLLEDRQGVVDWMHDTLYPEPADSPPISRVSGVGVEPVVTPTPSGADLAYDGATPLRGYRVYAWTNGAWAPHERLPPGATSVSLDAGKYAISALDRAGRESLGVAFTVP